MTWTPTTTENAVAVLIISMCAAVVAYLAGCAV